MIGDTQVMFVLFAARASFAIVLFASGASKVASSSEARSGLVPERAVGPLGTLEIATAALLLTPLGVPVGLPFTALLFATFGAATLVGLRHGRSGDSCGCGGVFNSARVSTSHATVVGLVSLAAAAAGIVAWASFPGMRWSPTPGQYAEATVTYSLVAVASALGVSARRLGNNVHTLKGESQRQ